MAGNSAFQPVTARGWSGGLGNLLRASFGQWFHTRMWWTQAALWTLVINGILAGVLWSGNEAPEVLDGVMLYSIFSGLFPSIAAVIIMQDAIVGEREAGTAAWVLSKPVSRAAFVLSKLIPNLVGVFVSMILIPGVVAYGQLSAFQGSPLNIPGFLAALAVMLVYDSFYMTLTLMLGTFFTHRAPVIGIPLALAFGQQMLFGIAPFLVKILPWTLVVPLNDRRDALAPALILREPLPDLTVLFITLFWILLFVTVSLWRFEKEEF